MPRGTLHAMWHVVCQVRAINAGGAGAADLHVSWPHIQACTHTPARMRTHARPHARTHAQRKHALRTTHAHATHPPTHPHARTLAHTQTHAVARTHVRARA
jgi:hypothetical protein